MELQTKFIEGTNEQYSIREDGVVTKHYNQKGKEDSIIKPYILNNNLMVKIKQNNKKVSTLVAIYFKDSKPKSRVKYKDGNSLNCNVNNLYVNVPMTKKELRKKEKKKNLERLPKHYIAVRLKMKSEEITPELYDAYVTSLRFKREFSKKNNISIGSFNLLSFEHLKINK
jgi:hypothetical protein